MRAVLLALLSLPVILSSICDKGKFLDGNQVCRDCGTGYMCPDGNTRVPCPPGTFQDVGAQSSCQECFPTTYQVNISNPILDFVSNTNNYGPEKQKKKQDLSGQTSCKACDPIWGVGRTSLQSRATNCTSCVEGTFFLSPLVQGQQYQT